MKDAYAFGRWGWNEGQHESFCYTEDNEGVELGVYARARSGIAASTAPAPPSFPADSPRRTRPISPTAAWDFCWEMARLNYGRENIEEVFYTAHVWRGLFFAGDVQHINNPGMNRARGPVTVPGIRHAPGILTTQSRHRLSLHDTRQT